MRAEVRDDIIALDTFVQARFKYEKYIKELYECGGYCFLDQFEDRFKNIDGRHVAKSLEDAGLIKTDYYSNYKFVRLSDPAMKYLKYKDDPRDFSQVKKNKIPVKKLKKNPSEKVLFFSAFKYELTKQGKNEIFFKNIFLRELKDAVKIIYRSNEATIETMKEDISKLTNEKNRIADIHNTYINIPLNLVKTIKEEDYERAKSRREEIESNMKFYSKNKKELEKAKTEEIKLKTLTQFAKDLRKELNKTANEYFELDKKIKEKMKRLKELEEENKEKDKKIKYAMQKILDFHDRSKCVPLLEINENKEIKLILIVVDTGSLKNKKGYWDLITKFLNDLEISYGNNYFGNSFKLGKIQVAFLTYHKDREKYIQSILKDLEYKFQKNRVSYKSRILTYINLGKYKEHVVKKIGYIKEKDIDTFKKLKEKLSKKDMLK